MATNQPRIPWLDLLRQLVPPTGLTFVGAGAGDSELLRYLQHSHGGCKVKLVEADEQTYRRLDAAVTRYPDWSLSRRLVASQQGPTKFHQASHAPESGLLEPESLRCLWPNLESRGSKTMDAVTLATLITELSSEMNWIWVDCLPATPILESAGDCLDEVELVLARVVLSDSDLPGAGADLTSVQTMLESRGFRWLATEASRHPAIGHALFVRDWNKTAMRIAREKQVADEQVAELKQQLIQLKLENDETVRIADTELNARLQLMKEEIAKAEIQIEMVKRLSISEGDA